MPEDFSVEASRAKRVERLNSRFRDRGGIFVPSAHNPLLDILLSRGVDGESPSKARARRRSLLQRQDSPLAHRHHTKPSELDETQTDHPPGESPPNHTAKGMGKAAAKVVKSKGRTKKDSKLSNPGRVEKESREDTVKERPTAGVRMRTSLNLKAVSSQCTELDGADPEPKAPRRVPERRKAQPKAAIAAAEETEPSHVAKAVKKRPRIIIDESDAADHNPADFKHARVAASTSKVTVAHAGEQQPAPWEDDSDIPLVYVIKSAEWKAKKKARLIGEIGQASGSKEPCLAPAAKSRRKRLREKVPLDAAADGDNIERLDGGPHFKARKTKTSEVSRHQTSVLTTATTTHSTIITTAATVTDDYVSSKAARAGQRKKRTLPQLPDSDTDEDAVLEDLPVTKDTVKVASNGRAAKMAKSKVRTEEIWPSLPKQEPPAKVERKAKSQLMPTEHDTEPGVKQATAPKKRRREDKENEAVAQEGKVKGDKGSYVPPRKRVKVPEDAQSVDAGDVLLEMTVQRVEIKRRGAAKGSGSSRTKSQVNARSKGGTTGTKASQHSKDKENNGKSSKAGSRVRKPRPRLSMFPVPALVVDSDDDPIDFLS